MNYSEMLNELRNAAPAATLDGIEVAGRLPSAHIAKTGLPSTATRESRDGRLIAALAEGFAPAIRTFVSDEIAKAVAPLQQRIAELESKPMPAWRGVFVHNASYRQLEFVVDGGALWVCKVSNTTSRPGTNDHWQLCAKSDRR